MSYLRMSVTDRCNLRCLYCMPEQGICKKTHSDMLSFEELYEIATVVADMGADKIRITGGEPLVRRGTVDFIERLSATGKYRDIAMTTNATLLREYGRGLRDAGLRRLNISIDTLKRDKFSHITRGGSLKATLDGIEYAKSLGFERIKLNTVLIGGFNDDEIESFVSLTEAEDIDVRFIELMPIGECAGWSVDKFVPVTKVADTCPRLEREETDDIHSPALYYRLPGAKGRVGLIEPISCKFCLKCNRLRITADGRLKTCLHSREETDIRDALKQGNLRETISQAVSAKQKEHHLDRGEYTDRNMMRIGG